VLPSRILFVVILLAARAATADTLPFEGKWARQGEPCTAAGAGGDSAPLVITATRLEATGFMTCDLTSVLPGGMSFRVEARCESNGEKGSEFFTFAVLSERLYWSWAGKTGTFERCPK
jgi:hypothetical protein